MHVLCRAKFYAEENEDYTLRITADDHYRLYLDGEFVQEGPAPSDPSHYFYETISLKKLSKGRHLLAVHVYYQGCVNRVFYSGDQRLAFSAELADSSGNPLSLAWKATECDAWSGEKIGYETQFLEHVDQRKYPKNWFKEIDFNDQEWEQISLKIHYKGKEYRIEKTKTDQRVRIR